MALLPKLYRFALKRLVGPFLVDNELSLDDFEVRLRAKEILLKNLVLDAAALNAFLDAASATATGGVEIVSAQIALCQLSFREATLLQLSRITLVVRQQTRRGRRRRIRSSSGNSSSPEEEEQEEEDAVVEDDDDLAAKPDFTEANTTINSTSVTEGMGFLETWVDRITATLQVEVLGLEVRFEEEEAAPSSAVVLRVERALTRNMLETRYRQTELCGLSLSLAVTASGGDDDLLLLLAELPHVLVHTPRPITTTTSAMTDQGEVDGMPTAAAAALLPVEVFVKSVALQLCPRRLVFVQSMYERFARSSSTAAPASSSSSQFVVNVESLAVNFSSSSVSPSQQQQLLLEVRGSALRASNTHCSLHRLDAVSTWAGADLAIDVQRAPDDAATEPDLVVDFATLRASLAVDVTLTTGLELAALSTLADAFAASVAVPSSSSASSSSPTLSLDLTGTVRIVLVRSSATTVPDEVVVEMQALTMESAGPSVSVASGVVWLKENDSEVPVFFLQDGIRVQVQSLEGPAPTTTTTSAEDAHDDDADDDDDDDEDEEVDIAHQARELERRALYLGQSALDLSLGKLSTPQHLDVALYHRFLALVMSVPASSSSSSSSSLVVRVTCKQGELLLGEGEDALQVTFQNATMLTCGTQTVVRAQHFTLSEYLEAEEDAAVRVPMLYSSPHASDATRCEPRLLAILNQITPLLATVKTVLTNVTFRVEPASTGLLRASLAFAPPADATSGTSPPPPPSSTALECCLRDCVFDLFPSESPFEANDDARLVPLSRMMLCCGEVFVRSNLVAGSLRSRFDVESRDAQLYLANHSERDDEEEETRLLVMSNDEYCLQAGFVRLGRWQNTLVFVRFDADSTELEVDMQDGRIMTCPDSFKVAMDLLLYLSSSSSTTSTGSSSSAAAASPKQESIDWQNNSSLSASDLRRFLATAPDSALSASQLKQRYESTVHLTPFVIEDYYTFAALPPAAVAATAVASAAAAAATTSTTKRAAAAVPVDDWVMCEDDAEDAFRPHKSAANVVSGKRSQAAAAAAVRPPAPPPAMVALGRPAVSPLQHTRAVAALSATSSIDEEEDADDDDADIMRNSIMFAAVTKMTGPAAASPARQRRPPQQQLDDDDDDEDGDEKTIQLIARADIDRGAERGIVGYKQLHESMLHIVHDIQTRDEEAEVAVNTESQMYRSALLGGGGSGGSSPSMWQPGQTLLNPTAADDEEEEESLLLAAAAAANWDGKYYDDNMDQVKIINHHFPVPSVPQPGSFAPPAAALAAKRIGEDVAAPDTLPPRGEFRFILRNGNLTWCLFGGRDFAELGEEEEEEQPQPQPVQQQQPVMVIEDHFTAAGAGGKLFPSRQRRRLVRREADRAIEVVLEGMSLVVDMFACDARVSLCLAVHDLAVRDELRTSPFADMVHFWDVEGEPRCTGADMLRISVELSQSSACSVKAASLPLRLQLHQDALDLLQQFGDAAAAGAGGKEEEPSLVFIRAFDFRAVKMKIDFYPKQVELARLREGKYTELVCLFNYEGMEVALKRALFRNVPASKLTWLVINLWAEDVYNKQLFNLLAGVSPGLAHIATDMANIVLLPVQALQANRGAGQAAGEAVRQSGRLAKTVFVEGIGMSHRVASGALNLLDDTRSRRRAPRTVEEGLVQAGQALAERAKNAQHTIIAVPLATLRKEGASGAVKSVIRAIPIAVLQPFLGVGEAFEAITVAAQHSLQPSSSSSSSLAYYHKQQQQQLQHKKKKLIKKV